MTLLDLTSIHLWINKHRISLVFFTIVFFLVLIVVNGFFCFPMGDDYSYALMGKKHNLFEITLSEYKTWNGRFISNLFVVLNPIRWDSLFLYRITPFLLIIFFWFSLKRLSSLIFDHPRLQLISSGVFMLIYIQGMPIISEGLYWFTGSITYFLGLVFFNFFLSISHTNFHFFSWKSYLIFLLMLMLAIGSNEVLAIWCVLITCVISFLQRRIKTEFLLALLFFGIVLFAPGNQNRMSHFDNTHNLIHSATMTVKQMLRFTFYWFFSISNLFFVALLIALKPAINEFLKKGIEKTSVLLLLVMYILLLSTSIFPAYWSTGMMGQHRTVNLAYQFFLILELLLILQMDFRFPVSNRVKYLVVFMLIFSLLTSGNIGNIIKDFSNGKTLGFYVQNNQRIEDFKKKKELTCIPKITSIPKSFVNYEITSDSTNWKNTCYRDFYNLAVPPIICNE